MLLIREFSKETEKLLIRISEQSKSLQVRNRAKCILLKYHRVSIAQLMTIFRVSRKTIYNWLTRWEDSGFLGLYNQPGRGRKPKLNLVQKEQVKQWVKEEPKSLKKVVNKINQEWGIEVHKETVKRIIKKWQMKWKRMKRGLSKTPQEWELEFKLPMLLELKEKDKKGDIDLRYLDESGFSLWSLVPYGWQEKGKTITLKSSQSKRINVLGVMNRNNQLFYQIHSGKIDSEVVINFLDEFSNNLVKPTVVILDQASIHTSDRLIKKLEEWQQKKLSLFWLPPYSPKHNLIEILWRFIKYEWIEINAYDNWQSLLNYLKKVLDNFGTEYVINFV
jgi:transposase